VSDEGDQALLDRVVTGLRDFVGQPGHRQIKSNAEWARRQFETDAGKRRDYLQAAVQHSHLFQTDAAAILGHVEPVVAHFASDGLTREDYFRAVAAEPRLLLQKPATVINNLEAVMTHYDANLAMRREYLQSALAQPELFRTAPSQVFAAIEAEADRLEAQGTSPAGSVPSTQVNHPALSCSHAAAQGQGR
jgi:hypothetical protein